MPSNHRRAVTLSGVLLVLALGSVPSHACQCADKSPLADALTAADAVFDGTVTSIEDRFTLFRRSKWWFKTLFNRLAVADNIRQFQDDSAIAAHFQVSRSWKGPQAPDLVVITGRGGGDCGFTFLKGRPYIVYARRNQDGELTTTICSRTILRERAVGEVKELDRAKETQSTR